MSACMIIILESFIYLFMSIIGVNSYEQITVQSISIVMKTIVFVLGHHLNVIL